MGGAVSPGENNDELIDNLVNANYITSKEIEEIFRAVDRGFYYLNEFKDSAYQDLAWRHEHLHLSAPCIYSKVLSYLDLKPGHSFLNIGSGTGYFSTLAGLILGSSGINHGVELHEDVVDYAKKKIKEFISQSPCFDRYTFCEPQFVVGNCLHIAPESPGYDRIYCGAACPPEHESFVKNLLNQDGLLIMPSNDQLQVIKRTGQSKWETSNILSVSFATLITPSDDERHKITHLPTRNPRSLYDLCRFRIRQVLSTNYHHGSNRRFKRKQHISEREKGLRMTSGSDESSLSSQSSDDSQSTPHTPRSGSILDMSTCTLITFGADGKEEVPRSSSSSSSRQDGSSTSARGDGENPSSSLKKKRRSRITFKRSSTKTKRDVEPKRSKARKGWDLIRRKFKNRKTEKSIFSPEPTKEPGPSASVDDSRLQPDSDSEDETSITREDSDDVQPQSSADHDVAPRISLRSFLLGMSTQLNSPNPNRAALRDGLYNYVDHQRKLAQKRTNERKMAEDMQSDDEIIFSTRDFYSAILNLPLPEPIKQYLLFYRCPN